MNAWQRQPRSAALGALAARAGEWLLKPSEDEPDALRDDLAYGDEAQWRPPSRASGDDFRPRLRVVPDLDALPPELLAGDLPDTHHDAWTRNEPEAPDPFLDPPRPVVVVLGLGPGVGTSTIARAVATRLAAEDPDGAAVLVTDTLPRTPVRTPAASQLARVLADDGLGAPRAAGRLCLIAADEPLALLAADRPAPIVADQAFATPADGALALADHVVLVCRPDVEPSLARAVETSLRERSHGVSLVLNRVVEPDPPDLPQAVTVPEARLAAGMTRLGWTARGGLGAAATELAERSLAEVWR